MEMSGFEVTVGEMRELMNQRRENSLRAIAAYEPHGVLTLCEKLHTSHTDGASLSNSSQQFSMYKSC